MNRFLLIFVMFFGYTLTAQTFVVTDTAMVWDNLDSIAKHPLDVYKVNLRKQKLKEFPKVLFECTNLTSLDLGKNKLITIPANIGELKNLTFLNLEKNKIDMLPSEIGNLLNLEIFKAGENEISLIPTTIGNLVNLEYLDLWNNNITEFPDQLSNLKNLKKMDLRVILINESQQLRIRNLLPHAIIEFSPACNCK